jgi:hypothetical protein
MAKGAATGRLEWQRNGSVIMREAGDPLTHSSLYRKPCHEVSSAAEREEGYEPASGPNQPSEHLLHLLWQRQELLHQALMTLEQQAITVYRPGRWSRSSGPDFLDAKLRLGNGPIRVGAVEVHVLASDWFHHGHHRDPEYTKVLLHVVWRNDLEAQTVIDASGREIPQLALSTALTTPPGELQSLLEGESLPTEPGAAMTPCQRSLLEMAPETVGRLLEMAGEERWRQKANRFALRAERRGVEQALYESLLEALGFKGNRMPFWQLARLAPVARIREVLAATQATPMHVQAILYGVAGFLQQWQKARRKPQPESHAYLARLATYWEPVAKLFPESVDGRQWRLLGIRPANFPQRRIAAAGYWLADLWQHSLMDTLFTPMRAIEAQASRGLLRRCTQDLVRRLHVTGEEDFWSRRYTIDGPELRRAVDLLGPGRATTIVVDVLWPAAAALAQLGEEPISIAAVRALYLCHPRQPANEVTREMIRQFFGADRARAAIVNSACRQQGLMQLYRDFCLSELETCQECALPRLLARLERLQRDMSPKGP